MHILHEYKISVRYFRRILLKIACMHTWTIKSKSNMIIFLDNFNSIFIWLLPFSYLHEATQQAYKSVINNRESWWGNQEWKIQIHRQHLVHKTQDQVKQSKKTQHRQLKRREAPTQQKQGLSPVFWYSIRYTNSSQSWL